MKKVFMLLLAVVINLQFINAQNAIITHEYRKVAPVDMEEYLKRETTYWKVFAENEVKNGNLRFWGIFQRIDGTELDSGPNILIVNSFMDMDKGVDWENITSLFPDVNMDKMNTWDMSTTVQRIFIRDLPNHIRKPNTVPEKDYNYVKFIYHNVKNMGSHLTFEAEKWKPLVERAWKEGKTSMTGWGNGTIILPESNAFNYNSYSYDIFATMNDALSPGFSEDLSISDDFWDPLQGNYNGVRNVHLYRVVAAVQAPAE